LCNISKVEWSQAIKNLNMENNSEQMTFLGHINELRKRLLISIIALVVTTVASFAFSQKLAEILAKPIGGLAAMSSIEVTENLSVFMKISLLSGLILALPIILIELLGFIMPGLKPGERKWIWIVIPVGTLFFAGGVAFAYFVFLPSALPFLLNFMGITTIPRPNNYFDFILNLLFWVGVCFEMPLVVMVLARLGIVSAKTLLKRWRIAIVVAAVLAAFITPTSDPVNMGLLMLPLIGLYFISILFAAIAWKKRAGKVENESLN
jgi:sec-independent protein translocase protein TatC